MRHPARLHTLAAGLFWALCCLTGWDGVANAAPPTTRHTLELRLDLEAHTVHVQDDVIVPAGITIEQFRLDSRAEILSLRINHRNPAFTFENGRLRVDAQTWWPNAPNRLEIDYTIRYEDPLPEHTVGVEDPSFGVSAIISLQGVYLSSSVTWLPQFGVLRNLYTVRAVAPDGFVTVMAGRLIAHDKTTSASLTEWRTEVPLDGLTLAAGPYEIFEERSGDIQVLAFLTHDNRQFARAYLDAITRYLDFYQKRLGSYPFTKFAVVENFLPTGYGLPSWTLLGQNVIRLPFIPHTSLPHEIVHSWWGNAVEVDYAQGNWAEGLTTYLSDYLLKELQDEESARDYRRKILREYAVLVSPHNDFPLNRFVSRKAKYQQAIGYGKAAMVFHMLRKELGDDIFWATLRRLAQEGQQQRLSWQDLQQAFSSMTGRNLGRFFDQWLTQPGAPRLQIDKLAVKNSDAGWVVTGEITQDSPAYAIKVPIRLNTTEGSTETIIETTSTRTPFLLTSSTPPRQIEVDPGQDLFRRLDETEIPPTVNDLRGAADVLVVRATKDPGLIRACDDLLRGFQLQNAPQVDLTALSADQVAGRNLLVIGWPDQAGQIASLAQDIAADSQSFTWGGKVYNKQEEALYLTLKDPRKPKRAIAIFHPLSPEAALAAARKIPHYGRYSVLVFRDGTNLIKQTMEAKSSPLTVRLTDMEK